MLPDLTLHGSLTIDVRIYLVGRCFTRDIPPTCREGLAPVTGQGLDAVPLPSSSGSLAMLTAMRRASPRLMRCAAERLPGSSSKCTENAQSTGTARRLEGHGIRRCALGVFSGLNDHTDAVISGDARFDPVTRRFHPSISGLGIDHNSLAPQDVLALADHDVSGQRNRLCLHVVDAQIPGRILILTDHGHVAARFGPAEGSSIRDGWGAAALGGRGGDGLGSLFRPVEYDKGSACHRGVALHHLDVAGKRRCLDLVLNFQRFRFDIDRLISVHTRRCALGLVLRRSRSGHPQDQHRGKAVIRNS
jgi:hypothetical protein